MTKSKSATSSIVIPSYFVKHSANNVVFVIATRVAGAAVT